MTKSVETEHVQEYFITLDGKVTTVDKGIYGVICLLRKAGVKTQYSCEGGIFSAYVLSDLRSAIPLLIKASTKRQLSLNAKKTRRNFLTGDWVCDVGWSTKDNNELFRKKFRIGSDDPQCYELELCISNPYGFRFIMRWPENRTDEIESFLLEIV